jgi:hypothetical protein
MSLRSVPPVADLVLVRSMTRIRRFRVGILAGTCGVALLLPWSNLGILASIYVVPFVLGVLIGLLFADRRLLFRIGIVLGITAMVAVARLFWEAIVLDGGDFSFDGERDLVVTGIILQFVIAVVGLFVVWVIRAWRASLHDGTTI